MISPTLQISDHKNQLGPSIIVWHGFGHELIRFCKSAPRNFFLRGIKAGKPVRADGPILPAHVANQNTGFSHFK